MSHIHQNSLATIYFELFWESSHALHVERYLAKDVNFTRDMLPLGVKSRMLGLGIGDSVEMMVDPSEVPGYKPGKVLDMPHDRFVPPEINGRRIRPRIGRFYPKNFITDVPGTRPDSDSPFRVVEVDKSGFKADLNHPMAGREVRVKARVLDITSQEAGPGKLRRWPEEMFKGPGMQARLPETPTDFLGAEPFLREDENDDAEFYTTQCNGDHIDRQAAENVRKIHASLLTDTMDILDLMAGPVSHLPEGSRPKSVTGLGLSAKEMGCNPALTKSVVHNLNEDPVLPFADDSFDAVICSMSVEYLTQPFEVFEDLARVLRPGGVFVVTFSNHWFPPKVIRVWTELHEFERMGLVSQYFVRGEKFKAICTASDRKWPRLPNDTDRESPELEESDPVYAVWAVTT